MKPVWLMQPIRYFREKLEEVWIWDKKLDGWKMQIIKKENGEIEFWRRRLEKIFNWKEKLRYLIPFIEKIIPCGTILDSKLCVCKGGRFILSLFAALSKNKPLVYVFDVIYLNKEFIGISPLEKRKKTFKEFKLRPPFYFLIFQKLKNIERIFEKAWKEVLRISRSYDKGVLLSQRYFFEAVYVEKWRKLAEES